MAVFGQQIQLVVYLTVEYPVHAAAEGQRVALVEVLLVVGQVLVHVDEGTALQADSVGIDEVDESAVRSERSVGDDHYRVLARVVVFLDQLGDLDRHTPVEVVLSVADRETDSAADSELILGYQVDIFHDSILSCLYGSKAVILATM